VFIYRIDKVLYDTLESFWTNRSDPPPARFSAEAAESRGFRGFERSRGQMNPCVLLFMRVRLVFSQRMDVSYDFIASADKFFQLSPARA
jgi:hypothetical protein